ncbi:MAG: hypothetical protein WBB94_03880 [Candidatus Saccharimonadaceae bacterium]
MLTDPPDSRTDIEDEIRKLAEDAEIAGSPDLLICVPARGQWSNPGVLKELSNLAERNDHIGERARKLAPEFGAIFVGVRP